jgi:hypothetical protein
MILFIRWLIAKIRYNYDWKTFCNNFQKRYTDLEVKNFCHLYINHVEYYDGEVDFHKLFDLWKTKQVGYKYLCDICKKREKGCEDPDDEKTAICCVGFERRKK